MLTVALIWRSTSRFPDRQPALVAVCLGRFCALGKLNAKRPGLARYVILLRYTQRLFAFADELLFSLFQTVLDIIAEARAVTAERLAGLVQGQALLAVFGQGMAPVNGLVFSRIINQLKLLLDRHNAQQGGIQTACHFLVVGPGVALQIILDAIPLHLYDRFRIAAGRDLLDMRTGSFLHQPVFRRSALPCVH